MFSIFRCVKKKQTRCLTNIVETIVMLRSSRCHHANASMEAATDVADTAKDTPAEGDVGWRLGVTCGNAVQCY